MTNECYKSYTMKKTLDKLVESTNVRHQSEESPGEPEFRSARSQVMSRPPSGLQCDIYSLKCVVCTHAKHQGTYEKFRISEIDRARKLLAATVFLQDDVYVRTCDFQDEYSVFGGDLYCHKSCIKKYLLKYDRVKPKPEGNQPMNHKKRA